MGGDKREQWITWLALTTAFMAVFAATTTMYMGKFSTRAVMAQAQESDQWAYYQAKSIKGHAYELGKRSLELELLTKGKSMSPEARAALTDTIAEYAGQVQRYDTEKAEIKAKAEELAVEKVKAQQRSGNFGYGLLFLQSAIMLTSIAAVLKKKPLWVVGLMGVTAWLYFFLNAWQVIGK